MNWKLILLLPLVGLILGVASLFGLSGAIGFLVWLVAAAVIAGVIGKMAGKRYFLHGLLTGLITGALPAILQVIFSGMVLANNPAIQDKLADLPEGFPVAALFAIGIPVGAIFWGVVIGLLSWGAGAIFGRKKGALPADPPEA